jgi:hypothetical protein
VRESFFQLHLHRQTAVADDLGIRVGQMLGWRAAAEGFDQEHVAPDRFTPQLEVGGRLSLAEGTATH